MTIVTQHQNEILLQYAITAMTLRKVDNMKPDDVIDCRWRAEEKIALNKILFNLECELALLNFDLVELKK